MADFENPTVEVGMPEESAADDAQQAQLGEALSTITDEVEAEQQETQPEQQQHTEPGWMKQRIGKAVDKAVAEAEARIAARYEAQISELQAERLERQAQDLVRSGEFKSLDTAKEYLQLKGGRVEAPKQAEQQAAEQTPDIDPVIQAKADMLAAQARKIKASRGLDVMAAYNSNPEIQRKLASGEWDFYDVAEAMSQDRRAPTISRSANGARSEKKSISEMSEAEWHRLQQNLANGKRYR